MKTILVMVRDLMFASKIEAAAKATQTPIAWVSRKRTLQDVVRDKNPDVLLVDLAEPGALEALREVRASTPALRILGYTGHTQTQLLGAARALGVEVMSNGELSANVDTILLRERG